jgi:hypothetical protein
MSTYTVVGIPGYISPEHYKQFVNHYSQI